MTTAPSPFAYEFRFFGPSLERERERLSAAGVAANPEDHTETYFVSRLTIDASVKIRAHQLEIKELTERSGLLEGWVRVQAMKLPVAGDQFLTEAAARLGVTLDIEKERLYSEAELAALASAVPSLRLLTLGKRRTIFDLDDLRGEFASVTLDDHVVDTIAFEGADPSSLMALIKDLGFSNRLNESYPCYLQRVAFYDKG